MEKTKQRIAYIENLVVNNDYHFLLDAYAEKYDREAPEKVAQAYADSLAVKYKDLVDLVLVRNKEIRAVRSKITGQVWEVEPEEETEEEIIIFERPVT